MRINEYQHKAQRTSSTQFCGEKLENGALGLAGEVAEAMMIIHNRDGDTGSEPMLHELGDILWYLCEIAVGVDMSTPNSQSYSAEDIFGEEDFEGIDRFTEGEGNYRNISPEAIAITLSVRAGAICDMVEKWRYQGHIMNYEMLSEMIHICMIILSDLTWSLGFTMERVAEENINKLRKRYKKGVFEVIRSVNREE